MPFVWASLHSSYLETPAWIRAQGSHHALPQSGGELAITALGGGRSSLSVTVSRKSIAHIRGPHPELQKLWAALCLPRRSAEREGCLKTEVGPLDSGGRCLGILISRRAVPPGGEGSLHLAPGASLVDICRAAGWATPKTFARFYSLRVEPVSSRVLGKKVMSGKNWPVSCLLRHSPSPGDTSAFFSSSSVPRTVNPHGILQAPSAVRLGGEVWRHAQYWC